jgi:hypothetical protein
MLIAALASRPGAPLVDKRDQVADRGLEDQPAFSAVARVGSPCTPLLVQRPQISLKRTG